MAIFPKALRVKDSKATGDKPEAINLISSDTASFSMFTAVNYILPFSLIKFSFAVLFLLRLLGWQSTLVAVIATVITVPVHTRVIKNERAANKRVTVARDRKTKAITEALQTLRQIKFSAVEKEWEERIEVCRLAEMIEMRKRFLAISIRSAWKVASPLIVTAAAVCSYVYIHNEVSSSILFTTIELLPHIQGALGTVPKVLQDYFGARANAKRMEVFLKMPEARQILSQSPSGGVSFRNASITWPSDEDQELKEKQRNLPPPFILHSLNVEFPAGELSVIHGETGSGKSLMLAAIIGEVDLLSGSIETQSIGQPVAFVSQTPWLQNDTIKNNILFGSHSDDIRYQKVLRACALDTDLAALPKGDETYVGLHGVRLSGGQRARVSLARALYSSAKLLVLDDIFAALDSHVSNEIFKALTGELCVGRTRILTTHHVSLCLPKAKCFVQVRNNTIEKLHDVDLVESQLEKMEPGIAIELNPAEREPKGRVNVKPKPKTIQAESDFGFYQKYFAATGGLAVSIQNAAKYQSMA
ncbi:hypothetical protein F66182_14506 [Fusarium sp. NRRL 66182]|nr:hypothetical protein F66182_14506 [Fusarium sp. NRRL 66182]